MFRNPTLVRKPNSAEVTRYGRGRANDQQTGRGFDAAGASGLAFLQSQLELVDTDLVKPLQAVTHPRDITVEVGGGFPEFISAFASNYASTGSKYFGIQGTNNTEIPELQADIQKGLWKVLDWAVAMTITYFDLKRLETAHRTGIAPPFSLQELYEESCETVWNKALDLIVYNGVFGMPGLINNPAVPETAVLTSPTGKVRWADKQPVDILNDVNYLLNTCMANSGYDASEGMPDRLLVPYTQYALLTQPMTLGAGPGIGSGLTSTLEYIEKQCVAAHHGVPFKINFLPNDWISGKGAGSPATDRCVAYKNSKKNLYLKVPQPMTKGMIVPTMQRGGAYETAFVGCFSQVIFKRTTTMCYGDGI
jgi:hypothetical protein